jgi:hypothetical protein
MASESGFTTPPRLTRQNAVYVPLVYVVYDAQDDGIGHLPGVSQDGIYTQFTFTVLMEQALPIWQTQPGFAEDPMPSVVPAMDQYYERTQELADWAGAAGIFLQYEDARREAVNRGLIVEDDSDYENPPSPPPSTLSPPFPLTPPGAPIRRHLTYDDSDQDSDRDTVATEYDNAPDASNSGVSRRLNLLSQELISALDDDSPPPGYEEDSEGNLIPISGYAQPTSDTESFRTITPPLPRQTYQENPFFEYDFTSTIS